MPLCSCKAECNCAISVNDDPVDNGLLLITGNGNPDQGGWKLRVVETPWDGTGDGAIVITTDGAGSDNDGHTPTFALQTQDTGTIALTVDANGLRADALSVGPAGGGTPSGTIEDTLLDVAPAGYVMASGPNYAGYIPIDDAPGLYGIVGHSESGGVDPGDGTFLVPYLGEKFLLGAGGPYVKGAIDGAATVPLGINHLPPHDHPAPVSGSLSASASTDVHDGGVHNHNGAGANHDFVVESDTPDSYVYLHIDAINVDTAGTMRFTSSGVDGGLSRKPNREPLASGTDSSHDHGATTTVTLAGGFTVDVENTGGGEAHNNMPPYRVVNRIIKT